MALRQEGPDTIIANRHEVPLILPHLARDVQLATAKEKMPPWKLPDGIGSEGGI
ncbi:hypothetical protein [Flagellimonas beolgyonensis]|uniref:hypothetical protein n=1 Tax=Flagellimonas beolgyonensis TaxID=864064 RepID=UPI0013E06F96|nr:hypothetical protein [Allomuricauda beolgyonensis]